jgi:hypothetical protein
MKKNLKKWTGSTKVMPFFCCHFAVMCATIAMLMVFIGALKSPVQAF